MRIFIHFLLVAFISLGVFCATMNSLGYQLCKQHDIETKEETE